MSSDQQKVEQAFPLAKDNEFIKSLIEALDDARDVSAMAHSEGGQALAKALKENCNIIVGRIRSEYMKLPDTELRALCATIDAQMSLYEDLTSAGLIVDTAQKGLDEALEEL